LKIENGKLKDKEELFYFSVFHFPFSLSCCILINLIFNSQFSIFNYRL